MTQNTATSYLMGVVCLVVGTVMAVIALIYDRNNRPCPQLQFEKDELLYRMERGIANQLRAGNFEEAFKEISGILEIYRTDLGKEEAISIKRRESSDLLMKRTILPAIKKADGFSNHEIGLWIRVLDRMLQIDHFNPTVYEAMAHAYSMKQDEEKAGYNLEIAQKLRKKESPLAYRHLVKNEEARELIRQEEAARIKGDGSRRSRLWFLFKHWRVLIYDEDLKQWHQTTIILAPHPFKIIRQLWQLASKTDDAYAQGYRLSQEHYPDQMAWAIRSGLAKAVEEHWNFNEAAIERRKDDGLKEVPIVLGMMALPAGAGMYSWSTRWLRPGPLAGLSAKDLDKKGDVEKKRERAIEELRFLILLLLLLFFILLMCFIKPRGLALKPALPAEVLFPTMPSLVLSHPALFFPLAGFKEVRENRSFNRTPVEIEAQGCPKIFLKQEPLFFAFNPITLLPVFWLSSDGGWVFWEWVLFYWGFWCWESIELLFFGVITVCVNFIKVTITVRERQIVLYLAGLLNGPLSEIFDLMFFTVFTFDISFTSTTYQYTIVL